MRILIQLNLIAGKTGPAVAKKKSGYGMGGKKYLNGRTEKT